APEGFTGVALTDVDLFLPITTTKFDAGPAALTSRDYSWVRVVARLAPGVTIPQAQAEAKVVYQRGNPSAAASPVPSWQIAMLGGQPADVHPVMQLRRELATSSIPITLWLLGLATAVLLIACANVGGLMLARGVHNRREIAVRAALGASRVQLFGELFLESGMLALAGGVLGFVASRWADGLIRRFILTDLAVVASPLDVRLVALAVGVTTVTALASGVWPATRAVRGSLIGEIANAARSVGLSDAGMRPGFITYGYSVPGRDSLPHVAKYFSAVTAGFFETLGTPIVLGRSFSRADRGAPVIIVNAGFARRYWPAGDPIGQCVKVGRPTSPCLQV